MRLKAILIWTAVFLTIGGAGMRAEDWPEFRGKGRLGVWTETGLLETFPASGLKVLWRTPIKAGFTGPSIADGRVFVSDFSSIQGRRGMERALALDEKTGKILWTQEWETTYLGFSHESGPRATPTVDDDRVYVAGASGILVCLNVKTGAVLWKRDYAKDFGSDTGQWGHSSAPIVDGNLVIALVGGIPDALMVGFDKMTGKEVWRALPTKTEQGVGQPIIITHGGIRQVVIFHPWGVHSLEPATGKVIWEAPMRQVGASMTVATPVLSGSNLLVSTFYNGSVMLTLDEKTPGASVLWKASDKVNELRTETLHSVNGTPIIQGDYLYGMCSYGQFRAVNAKTGERVWESMDVSHEKARWTSAFMTRLGAGSDRVLINNDRGELILAKLAPDAYHEISRTDLLKPTHPPGNRRQLGGVLWTEPGFANKHIYIRNDEEIIAVSMDAKDYK